MKVFLSHATSDMTVARQLASKLEAAGFDVWHAGEILPGDDAFQRVSEELQSSNAMVVLMTPEGARSEWVQREVEFALSNPNFSQKIFPVFLTGTDSRIEEGYPWILDRFKSFEIRNPNAESVEDLVTALKSA